MSRTTDERLRSLARAALLGTDSFAAERFAEQGAALLGSSAALVLWVQKERIRGATLVRASLVPRSEHQRYPVRRYAIRFPGDEDLTIFERGRVYRIDGSKALVLAGKTIAISTMRAPFTVIDIPLFELEVIR